MDPDHGFTRSLFLSLHFEYFNALSPALPHSPTPPSECALPENSCYCRRASTMS